MKFDFKKEYRDLYVPARSSIVDVPEMLFIMVDGRGNPNTSSEYKTAMEILYGLTYTIKMSQIRPKDYYEYVIPPLEGLWWFDDETGFDVSELKINDKDKFNWTVMIRQPEFVTTDWFDHYKEIFFTKKPNLNSSLVRFEQFTEGLCVQDMHIGSYDSEKVTIDSMMKFATANGYEADMAGTRRHHEIYIGDPRRTDESKLKTVIRHPIRRV